jgi:hypothetical protein
LEKSELSSSRSSKRRRLLVFLSPIKERLFEEGRGTWLKFILNL